jgi:release factor glutamine methyltransferase
MSEALARRALELVDRASRRLTAAAVQSARLDAELLLAEAAGVTREAVFTGSIDLPPVTLEKFDAMVARREKREPLAYIVGHREFYSLDFEVNSAVLIPRPETEFVVNTALQCVARKAGARVLDIGTGSGAIAIAIAVNAPRARIVATDISADALEVASRNRRRHRVEARITLRRADCFDVLDEGEPLGLFDVIAANPPYLEEAGIAALEPDVRNFEPRVALGAGGDGLNLIRQIASQAPTHLVPAGELIFEVAMGQVASVSKLIEGAGLSVVSVINDLAGHPRVVLARTAQA